MSRRLQGAALLALTLTACDGPGGPSGTLQGAVVILLDTVRADHLSCYGYARETSPRIDALARRGVRFEQVVSYSPWTLPSVVSLLAAEYPERVFAERLERSAVATLSAQGIATAAITEGGFVSRHFGLDLGFQHFEQEEGAVQLLAPGQPRDASQEASVIGHTFARAVDWLREHREERFFLFVHTYEPHAPYTRHDFTAGLDPGQVGDAFRIEMLPFLKLGRIELSDAERAYATALYDGGIAESDRHVGVLLDALAELGLDQRTLVVVTSDHGEELGEHYPSYFGDHGHTLYDPLLLVPLVVYDPQRAYPVPVVAPQARLIDVMPTVAERLGVDLGTLDGASLVPMMEGAETDDRAALCGQTKEGPVRAAVRSLGYKLITIRGAGSRQSFLRPEPPPVRLFDLAADPGELHNLAAERPQLVEALGRILAAQRLSPEQRLADRIAPERDEALLERLRSLGYIQ